MRLFFPILSLLLLPSALWAQAPERLPSAFAPYSSAAAGPASARVTLTAGEAAMSTRSVAGLAAPVLGAAIGLPLGMVIGGGLGYLIGPRGVADGSDGCMFLCVGSGPAIGLALGTTLGAGVGAHLANGRRGNPLVTGAASVGGAVAGIALGLSIGGTQESTPLGFGIAIPIMVAAPALAEWLTSY
ncbi:MAG: hypothetical protein H0U67_14315 [Gemmatimonadetes bacterium]|nr:hypothetical protein [Gemmatimonadota bacterium]